MGLIGLLQRVTEARVLVDGEQIGAIGPGLLVLAAVQPDDTQKTVERMAERLCGYRVFGDADGRMNLSLLDTGYSMLLVPQFTLAADTKKGMRPSFTRAAPPLMGAEFFDKLVTACRNHIPTVETGQFGADMQVGLVNDGPVTFWLEA